MVGIHYQAVLVMPALACTSVSVSAGIPPVLLVLLSAVVLADTPLHRPHYTADRSQSSEPPRPVPRVLWSVLEGCSIVGCLRVENVPVVADEWRMVQMQQGWTSERHRHQQQLGLNTSDNITSHSTVNVMDSAPIMCLLLLTCVLKLTVHCLNDYLVMNRMCFGRYYQKSRAMVTTCVIVTITDN